MQSKDKTFYKSFKYKENLSSSPKLVRFGLASKKKKWAFLKNQRKRDIYKISTPLHESPLQRISRSFALNWRGKQSFKSHFRVQRESHIKAFLKLAEKRSRKPRTGLNLDHPMGKKNLLFLQLWESRLDLALWRSALLPTLPTAREFIRKGAVFVNETKISKPSNLLKEGDFVQLRLKAKEKELLLQKIKENNFFQTSGSGHSFPSDAFPVKAPPFYLEVHFTSLSMVFSEPQLETILYSYPVGNLRL